MQSAPISNKTLRTARILGALTILFLLFDIVVNLLKMAPAVQATVQLGYPENTIRGIGILLLVCTVAYVIPRTSIFGAILLTGYLGGAAATQVRIGAPLFSILFPVLFAVLVWAPLLLRDPQLRTFIPLRR